MPRTAGSKNGVRRGRKVAKQVVYQEEYELPQAREDEREAMITKCDELLEDVENMLVMAVEMRKKLRALQKAQ